MRSGCKSWLLVSILSFGVAIVHAAEFKLIIDNQSHANFEYVQMIRGNAHVRAGTLMSGDVFSAMSDATYTAVRLNTQGVTSVIVVAAQKHLVKVRNQRCWDTNNRYTIDVEHEVGAPVWRFVIHPCDG